MSAPFIGSNTTQLGRNDRWVIGFLTLAAIVYALSTSILYRYFLDLGPKVTSVMIFGIAFFKAIQAPQAPPSRKAHAVLVVALLVMLALINCLISLDKVETSARWAIWFGVVFTLTRVARSTDGSWIEPAIRRLPVLFSIIYLAIVFTANGAEDETTLRAGYHLSGLYGNLILATGLFASSFWLRTVWVVVGFGAIYLSGAGGALFTVPIMFIPYILYSATSMPVKGLTVASLLFVGGLVFTQSQLFNQFLDIKLRIAPGQETSFTGYDRLERSKNVRLLLVQKGFEIARDNPMGTGLGHTYKEILSDETGMGHVHNGSISVLIETGYLGFAICTGVLGWVFWTVLRNKMIGNRIKGFYFTYFFTVFGRSLSENYTPFDLGNFFNVIFLMLTVYLFLYSDSPARKQVGHSQARGRPMRPMPPPMRPPPPLRGPAVVH